MSHAIKHDSVLFGGTLVSYCIRRSSERQTIGITVGQGRVTVMAPNGMRATAIRPFVLSKGAWIVAKLDEDRRMRRQWPRKLVSGESVFYLGRQYLLKVCRCSEADATGVRLWGGVLYLTLFKGWDADTAVSNGRLMFGRWCQGHLLKRLESLTSRYAHLLQVAVPTIRILDLGGRWGSCTSAGRIAFNWSLATVSPRLIEYVVAHEVCHLLQRKHDQSFYRLLTRLMPDWRMKHEELQLGCQGWSQWERQRTGSVDKEPK